MCVLKFYAVLSFYNRSYKAVKCCFKGHSGHKYGFTMVNEGFTQPPRL